MLSEAVKGLNRLRNSAILSLAASLFSLPLTAFSPFRGLGTATEDVVALFAVLIWVLVFGLLLLALMLAAWVLKVLGWWSLCKSGMRRFYCVTRYAVLLGPIIGVSLLLFGGVALVFEALSRGVLANGELGEMQEGTVLLYVLPGLLVMTIASVIEGVSALDVGLLTGVKSLTLGAVTYLIASLLQPLQLPTAALGSKELASGVASGLNWASSAVSLLASLLFAVGFHRAKGRVIQSEAQREAVGAA